MCIMTRGEFRQLPKNATLFLLLWSPDSVAVLRCKKRGDRGSTDLAIDLDGQYGSVAPSSLSCEFKLGNTFTSIQDVFAQIDQHQKNPPEDWPPVPSDQIQLFAVS